MAISVRPGHSFSGLDKKTGAVAQKTGGIRKNAARPGNFGPRSSPVDAGDRRKLCRRRLNSADNPYEAIAEAYLQERDTYLNYTSKGARKQYEMQI